MSSFHSSTSRIFQRNDDAAWRVVTAAYRNAAEKKTVFIFFFLPTVCLRETLSRACCGLWTSFDVSGSFSGVGRVVQLCACCAVELCFPVNCRNDDGGSASSYSPSSLRHLSVDHNLNWKGCQLWTFNEWFAFLFTSRPLRSISLMCVCSNELQHNHFGLIGATG